MGSLTTKHPIDSIYNGLYRHNSGEITDLEFGGFYWQARSQNADNANRLYIATTYLNPKNYGNKGHGFSLRCLVR